MTGLDNIIDEILTEARQEADSILNEARSKADEIRAKAFEQVNSQISAIESETDKKIQELTAAREAAFDLRRGQIILEASQTALNETLSAARLELNSLPDNEYFAFIVKLAAVHAESGEGILLFNDRDRMRMPINFQHLLNLALPEGKMLTVSDKTVRIDGGFIIKYGEIEENCSFAAIFRARREEFIDMIRGLLFMR